MSTFSSLRLALLVASLSLLLSLALSPVAGQSGDSLVAGLPGRAPVVNLNFLQAPAAGTNWTWAASDPSDSSTLAAIHQGVALLNGTSTSYIDISATPRAGQSAYGQRLPTPFGGVGFDGSGVSVEMVVKFPSTVGNLAACLFLFQDLVGSYMTMTYGNAYDAGDVDVGNRLEATLVNNAVAGLPAAAGAGHIEFFAPTNGTWYHLAWTLSLSTTLPGNSVWSIYVNGQLLNYANALVANSTLTPIQGANYPQASNRTIANIGADSFGNTFLATLDAFRVYDYLLPAQQVASLANAYQMYAPTPAPVSYAFPPTAESTAVNRVVSVPPIFSATFGQNPTTDPAIPRINYRWNLTDSTDSAALQSVHSGLLFFDGSAQSYVDLHQAAGPQSAGLILPVFGTNGSGTAGVNQGLSIEVVFKYPLGLTLNNGAKLFGFGQGGVETIDWAYQGSQIQFETQNNIQPGLEPWSGNGYYSTNFPSTGALNTGQWYHAVAVFSSPAFNTYASTLTVFINGVQVGTVSPYPFPLPVYRPYSFLGGGDYNNPNLPLVLDAFRIYDYALSTTQVTGLSGLYVPTCAAATVQGQTGGDFLAATLVPRPAVLNLNFTSSPSCVTGVQPNWNWQPSDPLDSGAVAAVHQGVAVLNGNLNSYIDVSATASPAQGAGGATLPSPFGGAGFDGSGWTVEMVVKFPTQNQNLAACLFLFQDAVGTWMTINTGNTFDTGDVDTPNRMQATINNGRLAGTAANATGASIEFFAPYANVWYHLTWVVQPYVGGAAGQGVWQFYVNGKPLNLASALIPNSSFVPVQGAAFPFPSTRTIATIGRDSGTNEYQMTVDAFRVYDYALKAPVVAALANAYQMLDTTPVPTSYAFPASTEHAAAVKLVPVAPIFESTFAYAPTTVPGISYTNWNWAAADSSDSPAIQALHPGVAMLNGSATSYINLQQSTGPQSCGLILPIFGLPGSGTRAPGAGQVLQGITFEASFKYPRGYTIQGGEKIFDFGQGGLETWDWAYQGGQIEFESQNQIGPGVLNGGSNRYAPNFPNALLPQLAVGYWQHVVMVVVGPSFTNYTAAAWNIYINGSLVGSQVPAIFPTPIVRTLSYFGGADYNNPNMPLVLDAFRIYDYALDGTTIASLYNNLYNPATAGFSASSGYLCFSTFGLPGTIDYPWSAAYSISFTYNPNPVLNGNSSAYSILTGTGTRTFTNRLGTVTTVSVTVVPSVTNNLLYVASNNGAAFDSSGLTLSVSSPVQLPGTSPSATVSSINLFGYGGGVVEAGAYRTDLLAQVISSNVPGFRNVTIGASNLNALSVVTGVCQASISFTNGLRAPIEGNANNGAQRFFYSYTISDGATYQVTANLTISCTSAFATPEDQLGNQYQTVVGISGFRTYTHLPSGSTITSNITGIASSTSADQTWYPYVLLSSSPGVYSTNSVPYLDAAGLAFTVSPAAPINGNAVGAGATTPTIRVFTLNLNSNPTAVLTEATYLTLPQLPLQQQVYTLPPRA